MKSWIFILITIAIFIQCTSKKKEDQLSKVIAFTDIKKNNTSLLCDLSFIKLETNEESLLEKIYQIEIFNKEIYILNNYGLYIFDLTGKYLKKLQTTGDGPGEFISPYSFWIDTNGYIILLDRQLNRLMKYEINTLDFVENIKMPFDSPISFAKMPGQNDLFIYYYPLRPKHGIDKKQVFIADAMGNIISELFDANESGRILHGNSSNFYLQHNELRFYPYFSNTIYNIKHDTLHSMYTLSFKENQFPDQKLFSKFDNSGDLMKEIIFGDSKWIRLIYVYETDDFLVVKYYIEKEMYVAVWDKNTEKTMNLKVDHFVDKIGVGGKFPLPIGTYGKQIIGEINLHNFDKNKVTNASLKTLTKDISEEDNPILVFYSFE